MMKSKVILASVLAVGVLVFLGYHFTVVRDKIAVAATQSCLSSLAAAIEETGGKEFIVVTQSDEWQTVSRDQMKRLPVMRRRVAFL